MDNNLKGKVTKIIPADELERHTEMGWEVMEGFDQDDIAEIPIEGNNEPQQSHFAPSTYPPGQHGRHPQIHPVRNGYKPVPVNRRYYVVTMLRDKVVSDLRADNGHLSQQLSEFNWKQERTKKEHEKAIEESEKKLAEEHDQLERVRRQRGSMETQRDDQIDRNRRLERDIGKLRAAIGDLKFKEIVGTNNEENEDEDVDDDEAMD